MRLNRTFQNLELNCADLLSTMTWQHACKNSATDQGVWATGRLELRHFSVDTAFTRSLLGAKTCVPAYLPYRIVFQFLSIYWHVPCCLFALLKVSISTYHIPLQRASTIPCTVHCSVRLQCLDSRLLDTSNLGVINGVGCLIISERFPNKSV